MTQYKILTKKLFKKEDAFLDTMNSEARNGWKVISVGYNEGHISKVVLEKSN
ncbi:hypothetical protein [Urechidicola vernalis]|uniref:DUF4177 domain-containing protein n=1 Tax=Urechidicola vernalis TaxID=3075600 RepID=A0ABU2Y4Z0_9FLAO|nr:hypothetical protein [Urechidicola sp. P050]MDT0552719.1 hypothetical protein [Urechidicola sp. P050]